MYSDLTPQSSMWEDSVGTLTENRVCGFGHLISYILLVYAIYHVFVFIWGTLSSCWDVSLCIYFIVGFFFSIFLSLFDVSFFLSFFNGQRFLMAEGVKTKTIIKLLFFISINGKKQ